MNVLLAMLIGLITYVLT